MALYCEGLMADSIPQLRKDLGEANRIISEMMSEMALIRLNPRIVNVEVPVDVVRIVTVEVPVEVIKTVTVEVPVEVIRRVHDTSEQTRLSGIIDALQKENAKIKSKLISKPKQIVIVKESMTD
jgi:hypothetical protein